ncbi:tRNA1(Val) (adenine(37)-N6)-methyltransferase [Pedobacter psychroterrae]|uniref:tRNA1(Val) (adenine(37)-N6)-methyltransferase n=1 Tax=Pedobacter psychroterrae TaxID=2530453 RepID=A0A4R0NG88_9SPHI|nr:methyltransferase [Pedobacter psychroterrae]TCC98293.1 methyltransferase domain-containing protein [Pedobacter psychroterrae]
MGNVFRFKQFEVDQEGCAMRINTDGVLLAAIAAHVKPSRILDIGTGTGVIALMMAQRFPTALIDAVEIDGSAALAAAGNFRSSPFADRVSAFQTDIAAYEPENRYDLIISNPPFFVNDLKNPESRKSLARHAAEDFFETLVLKAATLLSEVGVLWLILPVKSADQVVSIGKTAGLVLHKEVSICSDVTKPVIRKVIALGRTTRAAEEERLYIYEAEGVYTHAYKELLKDFFLAF